MGDVAIQYRLLPESPDANLDSLSDDIRSSLPSDAKLQSILRKPFAFGLTALEILVVMKDAGGISEQVEQALSSVNGIQSVELVEMSLI